MPQISTRELAQRMAANNEATPLLIDVRTREESKFLPTVSTVLLSVKILFSCEDLPEKALLP